MCIPNLPSLGAFRLGLLLGFLFSVLLALLRLHPEILLEVIDIERLEIEARRLAGVAGEGPASAATRNKVVGEVTALRRDGEMKSYIDLLFLAMVMLLCISKIVTD